MAKIIEDVVVISFSRIAKNDDDNTEVVSSDILPTLEQVAQELVGSSIVVEVTKK